MIKKIGCGILWLALLCPGVAWSAPEAAQSPAAPVSTAERSEKMTSEGEMLQADSGLRSEEYAVREQLPMGEVQSDKEQVLALWDEANTAYLNGDYRGAVEVYEQILDRGLFSAKLYYNLANAHFKAGDIGPSILYYNRALRLQPGDEDVRYNLAVAELQTRDRIDVIPEFFVVTWLRTLRHTMGCTAWSVLSLGLLGVMLGLLLLYLLASRIGVRKIGFYGTLTAFVLMVCAAWFAALERREILRNDEAIVMVSASAVKSSPDHAATDLFVLHEGTKVTVSAEVDDWREITLSDGKKGWIENRKIETI